ncbi:MAG: MFS transporter [Planctomycetaceae bacterium]|nr:MFS transporter [Planctomycetaceae bacterium]
MSHDSPDRQAVQPTNVRWVVLALVAFAAASAYLTRYCISAANTTMQEDLGFDNSQMGGLMSSFMLGYFLFQIPGGWLGTRFGTRAAFVVIAICWSMCNVWTAAASLMGMLWASRFMLGVFQAGMTPLSAKIVKDWIPLSRRGMSSSIIGASMSLGSALTVLLTGWLLEQEFGWRSIFAAYSLVAIVWALVFAWFFRSTPRDHASVNEAELELIERSPGEDSSNDDQEQTESGWSLTMQMAGSLSLWGLCVQSFFRAAGYVFFATWFFAFLEYVYHIEQDQAGVLNSLPLIAVVAGSLSGGVLVDRLLKTTGSKWISRSGTAFVAMTVCGLLTMASAWTETATQLSVVIAIGAYFSGIGLPVAWAATIDVGGRHTAVAMGIMNMAGCLAGAIMPYVLGSWFDDIQESGGDWNHVIFLHAAFYFVCAVSWLMVNPNRRID